MEKTQVERLMKEHRFPVSCSKPELIETHISWVIVCDQIVFKIKKPLKYSFLDFSTLEKRKFYCDQEVLLNRRLVEDVYLGVVPVIMRNGDLEIVLKEKDEIIDFAVMMQRLPTKKRMDLMLLTGGVSLDHIEQLAERLVLFHKNAPVIYSADHHSAHHDFNDLESEKEFLLTHLYKKYDQIISNAIEKSDSFITSHQTTLKTRSDLGYIRDCHGDLHSRNIFLLDEPVIFDCIEFNDKIRQIDILSELAFFCMDLEAAGYPELSEYFMVCYTKRAETIHTEQERDLFIYYKAYRANVRAKVNALRMRDSAGQDFIKARDDCIKYLELMEAYLNDLPREVIRRN